MIDIELFFSRPQKAFSNRDPNDPLSGWKIIGKGAIVDLPSVGDQICMAPGEVFRVRGVMHLAVNGAGGHRREPTVRLMVDPLAPSEFIVPAR